MTLALALHQIVSQALQVGYYQLEELIFSTGAPLTPLVQKPRDVTHVLRHAPPFSSFVSGSVHHLNEKCDGQAYVGSGRENLGGLFRGVRYLGRGSIAWSEMMTSKRPPR